MNFNKPKHFAANILASTFLLDRAFKLVSGRYIMAYHRVVPEAIAQNFKMQDSMWVSTDTFEDDVSWMKNLGTIVDLDTILDFEKTNETPLFSITFDDGWVDNYEQAFPILKKHDITATIFIVTEAVESGIIFWVEDLLYKVAQLTDIDVKSDNYSILTNYYYRAGGTSPVSSNLQEISENIAELIKPYSKDRRTDFLTDLYRDLNLDHTPLDNHILSWSNIKEMNMYGIEFGSHSHTHEILQYADTDTIKSELETSKNIIEENISTPVRYFCYPNARYRDDNAELLAKSGYQYAFRIHNLRLTTYQNNYFIPRFMMNERVCHNKNYLLCRLLGLPKF